MLLFYSGHARMLVGLGLVLWAILTVPGAIDLVGGCTGDAEGASCRRLPDGFGAVSQRIRAFLTFGGIHLVLGMGALLLPLFGVVLEAVTRMQQMD